MIGHRPIRLCECVSVPFAMTLSSSSRPCSTCVDVSMSTSGSSQPVWSTLQISIISWVAWENGRKAGQNSESNVRWDREAGRGGEGGWKRQGEVSTDGDLGFVLGWLDRIGVDLPGGLDPGCEKKRHAEEAEYFFKAQCHHSAWFWSFLPPVLSLALCANRTYTPS